MRRFVVPLSFLTKLVDKTAQYRYGITGDQFIELVKRNGDPGLPNSQDLTEIVRKHILA